jgi:hypothetical protein
MECDHPPRRLYAWHAFDDALVICCCDCGKVLLGAADQPDLEGEECRRIWSTEGPHTAIAFLKKGG